MFTRTFVVLLQAAGEAGEAGGDAAKPPQPSFPWLPLILIGFILWFLIFRPESKRRKELAAKIGGLVKGDHVVTIGGIHGEVMKVDTSDLLLQVDKDNKVRMRIRKSAVAEVVTPTAEGETAPTPDEKSLKS